MPKFSVSDRMQLAEDLRDSVAAETGVPQLFAPLVHICTESPCSERFGLVRTSKRHRYTFRV